MSDELVQNESRSQSSKASIFFKMFSFLIPLLDVIKLIIASVTSVILLAFACLTLGGSAVALIVSTPLFIIFSPILVPATIATTLLATGLAAGTTLGVTAIGLIMGLIKTAEGVWLARAGQSSFRRAGAGGGSRQELIRKLIAFLRKQSKGGMSGGGAGGGSREELIRKIIAFLKKQSKGRMSGGGAEPAGEAPPAGGADPAAGGTPTE